MGDVPININMLSENHVPILNCLGMRLFFLIGKMVLFTHLKNYLILTVFGEWSLTFPGSTKIDIKIADILKHQTLPWTRQIILRYCQTQAKLTIHTKLKDMWLLGCLDSHTIEQCKLLFGTVMYGYHMDQNPQGGAHNIIDFL